MVHVVSSTFFPLYSHLVLRKAWLRVEILVLLDLKDVPTFDIHHDYECGIKAMLSKACGNESLTITAEGDCGETLIEVHGKAIEPEEMLIEQ